MELSNNLIECVRRRELKVGVRERKKSKKLLAIILYKLSIGWARALSQKYSKAKMQETKKK